MPIRSINCPALACNLTNLMGAPSSSATPDAHQAGLDFYRKLGGNCLHLHGEGGETLSRLATGEWLNDHQLRSQFFLCAQICHDDWDEANRVEINRFNGAAVQEDIEEHLDLIRTNYLDLVYLDDSPDQPFEPVLDAIVHAQRAVQIRAFGVRNWSADRIRAADEYLRTAGRSTISALITTELALSHSVTPLWPRYVPFDANIRQIVAEIGLTVFAHVNDFNTGQILFGDADAQARLRPEWIHRWQLSENEQVVRRVRELAREKNATAREINVSYVLSERFPVCGIVYLPSLISPDRADYERASICSLTDLERRVLRGATEGGV
jgi:aryl-alcohol dehydrogenase-like predicted oxidoreductase